MSKKKRRSPSRKRYEKAKQKRRTDANRTYLAAIKAATPCADCGGCFHPQAMEYDHRDRSMKRDAVSRMMHRSREQIDAEIAKCELVCANCHRVRTYEAKAWKPIGHDPSPSRQMSLWGLVGSQMV